MRWASRKPSRRIEREEQRASGERRAHAAHRGAKSFYQAADHDGQPAHEYFDLHGANYQRLETRPGIIVLSDVKHARGVVKKNAGASLIDLGDGVLCLRVPQQDELAGRRPDRHDPRRHSTRLEAISTPW